MARSTSGESVAERIVRILEAFDAHHPVLTVSDIARRSDLPVTTAHRIVSEMVDLRLLERTEGKGVRVGVRTWELGTRASRVMRLRDAALPFMDDLHAIVRQHTQLGVLDGGEVLHLERLSAHDSIVNATYVAGRLPVHACSAGLVLLAYAAEPVREDYLARPLERYTPETIVDPGRLREIFAGIRAQGHCIADSMVIDAATGAAAPIFDGSGHVVAALTIVVPSGSERISGHVPALIATARGISRAMGVSADFLDSATPISDPKFFAIQRKNRRRVR